jgi:broad specificity phosphatase PhoE
MRNARLVIAIAAVAAACGSAPKPETTPELPAAGAAGSEGGPVLVYVVRHAEKLVAPNAPADPPLTEQGARRAAALAGAIDGKSLVAAYATPYVRTRSTAAPTAAAAGIPVSEYDPDDTPGLVAKIRALKSGSVLVVGHSNTVPEIVKALGVADPVALGDGDYGDLFVVALAEDGTAALDRRRFGDELPAARTGEPVP